MPKILSIDDFPLKGKRILVRVDFNVPLNENQKITDDTRIVESLPTIKKIIELGGKVILLSHLGRPKGTTNLKFSLRPIVERLSGLLQKPVNFCEDCLGEKVEESVSKMKEGDVLVLENVRFYKEEEENDMVFARKLSFNGDVYVNDAFGSAHRAHASTHGITKFMTPSLAGYLMQKELKFLGDAISSPQKPFTAILGGAKVSGKIDVIKNLFSKVDNILIGGGMMFTFFKAMGIEIGKSLVEEEKLQLASQILSEAKEKNINFILPVDCVVAEKFEATALHKIVDVKNIPKEWLGVDIGPKTIELFRSTILQSKTILWNGPMGVFEMEPFAKGTFLIANFLKEATENGAITIVGGGDSAAAVSQAKVSKSITHISTGGGASLEFLEGKTLPGVLALQRY
ncbi:MAG: phosphoglycerate kinase [Ignavibacteria bacterium]|nr:phosphoglycerate kinase [Bacteroidota bacterium]MSQ46580.1 phosphoglycerate kinase [Ignavibacteria bacterium]